MNWEYMIVDVVAGATQDLQYQLSALGSLGWEAVGYSCVVSIGPNTVSTLLRREVPALASPPDLDQGWKADPSGRFDQRHWDGVRWSQHVITDGEQSSDYPNVRQT